MHTITNGQVSIGADMELGRVTELKFQSDKAGMNYVISPEILRMFEYDDAAGMLLGGSRISYCGHNIDIGLRAPDEAETNGDGFKFSYRLDRILLTHSFTLNEGVMRWKITLENTHDAQLKIEELLHYMPVGYVIYKTVEENLNNSCAMTPSICGSRPYVICKKRSGEGENLVILNETGKLKSVGSYCRWTNLFFDKSSPSLNGTIIFSAVNAYKNLEMKSPTDDWMYKDAYDDIILKPGEVFEDSYVFAVCGEGREYEKLHELGAATVDYEPVSFCGNEARFAVTSSSKVTGCKIFVADDNVYEEDILVKISGNIVSAGPFGNPGERKAVFYMEDGTHCFIIFAVYVSFRDMTEDICSFIYSDRFVDDPDSPDYCAYKSVSLQGESCAKGAALLYKNLLSGNPNPEEIRQAERNTVYYIKPNWLDADMIPIKKYPGGFVRMWDIDYIVLQFYLLSKFGDLLQINHADTYLLWAYKLSLYRLEDTPDKTSRERGEMDGPFLALWDTNEITADLIAHGYEKEGLKLHALIEENKKLQGQADPDRATVTEWYFDNAGIAVSAEFLLTRGMAEAGMNVARLLLPNVAPTSDYRNFAPDRWWETMSPMYHNLWCVYPAKAMLSAYEYSKDVRYLKNAYRAMVPMFFNYDCNAVSTPRKLKKGEGISTYCITAPNMNLERASHNRMGQSAFRSVFFNRLELSGEDWDMGTDVLIYLQSFGQNAYVTGQGENLHGVNCSVSADNGEITARTYAPFGAMYYIEQYDLTIKRGGTNFTLGSITVKDGKCVKAEVTGEGDIIILAGIGGKTESIYPEIKLK